MKRKKSDKAKSKAKKEGKKNKSPIVTETNHPAEKLLENAKHTKKNNKQKAEQKPEKAEAKTQKHSWVTEQKYFIRFRFIVGDNCPKSFKKGQIKLFYAKSLEHLADRLVSIKYLEAWVGDTEKFNEKTHKWQVIEEFN